MAQFILQNIKSTYLQTIYFLWLHKSQCEPLIIPQSGHYLHPTFTLIDHALCHFLLSAGGGLYLTSRLSYISAMLELPG